MLPYETMLDIVEQLPDLEFIHYYNYGEPFINKDTIRFLSEVKRNKPTVHVSVSTNGTVLSPSQISAVAEGALVNQIIFSIDGATQESYQRYRVGGSFHKAFSKMVELTRACRDAGTWAKYSALDPSKVAITWQYILFEWNDSDEELEAAREMAREIDIPMLWVITSGYGASQRFLPGSDLVANLNSPPDFTINQAAQSQVETYLESNMLETIPISGILKKLPFDESVRVAENGVRGSSFSMVRQAFSKWLMGRPKLNRIAYDANISCGQSEILASPNETIIFDLEVANHSDISWDNKSLGHRIRLGLALQDERGALSEIGGTEIPTESTNAAGVGTTSFLVTLPNVGGDYSLIVDFVHEHVCWFSHRGSNPLVVKIKIENSSAQV